MSKKLLQVEHLSIALKNPYQDLVKDISFSLEEAGAVILLGQSGSGKTMTCRAILGLLNSSAFQVNGEIFFDNRSLLQLKEKERALYYGNKIAFIPQNPMTALDPSRKIGAQMAEFLNLHQDLKKKEALSLYEQALSRAGLTDTKRILSASIHRRLRLTMPLSGRRWPMRLIRKRSATVYSPVLKQLRNSCWIPLYRIAM